MRWFAFSLMVLGSTFIGCAPPEEIATEPAMPAVTSGTTVEAADGPATSSATPLPTGATTDAPATPAAETPAAETPATPAAEAPATPAAEPKTSSTTKPSGIRFVADQSMKVPGMMCPYSCWPKVKDTLAAQPGVEGVQLVAQAKEDSIDNPVVELKTNKDFNADAAIAALKKVNFDNAVVVK